MAISNGSKYLTRPSVIPLDLQEGLSEDLVGAVRRRSPVVASVALMKSLVASSLTDGNTVQVAGSDVDGLFVWEDGDKSAEVSGDPYQGVWVTLNSDPQGTLGAFRRAYSGAVNVRWFGAKGDGVADDTLSIQAALDYSSDVVVPLGHYMINGERLPGGNNNTRGLEITSSNRLLTVDKSAILEIIPQTESRSGILSIANGVDNVTISGGIWKGDKYTHPENHEFGMGLIINGATNIVVKDGVYKEFAGDGIFLSSAWYEYGIKSNNVVIDNCVLYNCRRHELTVLSVINLTVRDCSLYKTDTIIDNIQNTYYGGLNCDIEGFDYEETKGVVFVRCKFMSPVNYSIRADQVYSETDGVSIIDCVLDNDINNLGPGGFEFVNCKNVTVSGCTIRNLRADGDSWGARALRCDGVTFKGNLVENASNGFGVTTLSDVHSDNIDISNNTLSDMSGGFFGINARGLSNTRVSGNLIKDSCEFSVASIYVSGPSALISQGAIVSSNTVSSESQFLYQIHLERVNNSSVVSNNIQTSGISAAVYIKDCTAMVMSLNSIQNGATPTDYFVRLAGSPERILIKSNMFSSVAGSLADGVVLAQDTPSEVFFTDNFASSAATVDYTGGTLFEHYGNVLVDGTIEQSV